MITSASTRSAVKLELGPVAVVGAMATTDLANVLVEVGDPRLVDDQAEDHVDRLIGVVETTTRVAGLVHVRKPQFPPPADVPLSWRTA